MRVGVRGDSCSKVSRRTMLGPELVEHFLCVISKLSFPGIAVLTPCAAQYQPFMPSGQGGIRIRHEPEGGCPSRFWHSIPESTTVVALLGVRELAPALSA